MTKQIIILNGPPGSGKDFTADILKTELNSTTVKFAQYLKEAAHRLIGYPQWNHAHCESFKDVPQEMMFGLSPRQLYISLSEQFYKPVFGSSFFGDRLIEHVLTHNNNLFTVSDGGFEEEVAPLITHLSTKNILLVHIYREGCSFINDSRHYINIPELKTVEMYNKGEPYPTEIRNKLIPEIKSHFNIV